MSTGTPRTCGKRKRVIIDESESGSVSMLLECDLRQHSSGKCRIIWSDDLLIFYWPED